MQPCLQKHPFEDGNKLAICNGKYKLPEQPEYAAINTLIRTCSRPLELCRGPLLRHGVIIYLCLMDVHPGDGLLHQDPSERLTALQASVKFNS
jgi:hypothetical protein